MKAVGAVGRSDFTYFHILNWGWYFVGGVIDDYSRYLIRYDLMEKMDGHAVQELIAKAISDTGATNVPVDQRVKLLSVTAVVVQPSRSINTCRSAASTTSTPSAVIPRRTARSSG